MVTGLEDVVTPPDNARRLHAALANPLALVEVPEAGHAMPQERPGEVAAAMREAALV